MPGTRRAAGADAGQTATIGADARRTACGRGRHPAGAPRSRPTRGRQHPARTGIQQAGDRARPTPGTATTRPWAHTGTRQTGSGRRRRPADGVPPRPTPGRRRAAQADARPSWRSPAARGRRPVVTVAARSSSGPSGSAGGRRVVAACLRFPRRVPARAGARRRPPGHGPVGARPTDPRPTDPRPVGARPVGARPLSARLSRRRVVPGRGRPGRGGSGRGWRPGR